MKKIIGRIILIVSVLVGIMVILFPYDSMRYSECVVDNNQYDDIIHARAEIQEMLAGCIFDEEELIYDSESKTFYYSLIEGSDEAFNPNISIKSSEGNVRIAILEKKISEKNIVNNETIRFLAYTEKLYCEYNLKCTTLPCMNVTCADEIGGFYVPVGIEVFDNQEGPASRVVISEGEMRIRGRSTLGYLKKGYRLSLTTDSLGRNKRKNHISLLGMRQDDDWLLYAAYNDQEKIRNVFSSNLWKNSCAIDNEYHVDAGMEYKYMELFINGHYWGLYALGYPIDEKQLGMKGDLKREALYKNVSWADEDELQFSGNGQVNGYEVKSSKKQDTESIEDWSLLLEYYDNLHMYANDTERLYKGIDIDNAVDFYLFLNLIQGVDNVNNDLGTKNQYIAIHDIEDTLKALYIPWDMDLTWGNTWSDVEKNNTVPYIIGHDYNIIMKNGYLNQIILNDDSQIWERIFSKYWELRKNGWSNDSINLMLDEYESDIFGSGAFRRDQERWPDGTYADPEDGLSTFRKFVMDRLQVLDDYYKDLEEAD